MKDPGYKWDLDGFPRTNAAVGAKGVVNYPVQIEKAHSINYGPFLNKWTAIVTDPLMVRQASPPVPQGLPGPQELGPQ